MDKAFTVTTLAERWNCSRDVIYDMLRDGRLHAFRVGKNLRISPDEVRRFEEAGA